MLKHSKPQQSIPSVFVVKALKKYSLDSSLPLLDLPCGFGRNSVFISSLGMEVISVDLDKDVFTDAWYKTNPLIRPVRLDVNNGLPFKTEVFSAIVIIDFYLPKMFIAFKEHVAIGGLIVYQTYSARGGNWMELPTVNEVKNSLGDDFDFLEYVENVVGPDKKNVTLKMIARRISK